MISLTDHQLTIVMTAAGVEKRDVLLQMIAAPLMRQVGRDGARSFRPVWL